MQQYFSTKKDGKTLFLDKNDLNHIKNVMRFSSGDEVFIIYENISYLCKFNNDLLSADIIKVNNTKEESEVICYFPILQESKVDFILEKGTELGVTEFIPVEFERCKFKLDNKTFEKKQIRWNTICKEAAEQSRRNIIPKVSNKIKVPEIVGNNDVNILCSLDKENVKHVSKVLTKTNAYDKIKLLFGPEGGITGKEEEILVNNGFTKTRLLNNVLRTETVIVVLMGIINYLRSEEE